MKQFKLLFLFTVTLFLIAATSVQAQYYKDSKGVPGARKKNVHSGNQVRTTFFNYGLVGRENAAEDFGGEWPINSGHFYVGDISVMVGAEVKLDSSTITPVTVSDGPRGSNDVDPTNTNIFWGWEPLRGFDNPDTNIVAMSHLSRSWPESWPDRETDASDAGWPGQWNGFFGKDQFNADQESYWVMDDNRDKEFIRNNNFFPDPEDTTRGGLGLLAKVRGLQWSQTLAQNTIFWLYDITNIGATNYDKAVFGMIVGTTIGGDGDTGDDNSKFDAIENITYSWDNDDIGGTGWTPVKYMGYAFLESPGNSINGFDDDNDGEDGSSEIDVSLLLPVNATAGMDIVTIDYSDPTFPRTVTTFPAEGISFEANGNTFSFAVNDVLQEVPFNNVDDNLNGLIDENIEIPDDGIDNNNNTLIDEENPHIGLPYINYLAGETNLSNPLIDEDRDDGIDNDGDWDAGLDDVGLDGDPSTVDFGQGDGLPTSGYQPWGDNGELIDTGLPGEPNIDKTDIDESDQIGLTSFFFFNPFNFVRLRNDDQLWETLTPGFFNAGVQNVDGDFIYGTAYFPLNAGQTERISLAFFFGDNVDAIFRTKNTIQLIYNNDYNFAKAPVLPTLKAFAGDKKVTLYWDTKSEKSFDKLSQVVTGNGEDFEGYKVYRATFPTWDETGVITNVFGNRIGDLPIAQFDIVNADSGFFPVVDDQLGSVFYLGDNTGLVHTYTDTTVKNGFSYFYAVTAYDHGINAFDKDGELKILQPSETSKFAAITTGGNIELGQNVVYVRPEAPAAGYVPPGSLLDIVEHTEGDGTGSVLVEAIDPNRLKDGHTYKITFEDDGAFETKTSGFSVFDITDGSNDTLVFNNENVDLDAFVFDGVKLHIANDWIAGTDIKNVQWNDTTRNILTPTLDDGTGWARTALGFAQGVSFPANYQLEIGEAGVDTSAGITVFGLPPDNRVPVNFRVKNVSTNHYVKFNFLERHPVSGFDTGDDIGVLDENDFIFLFEPNGNEQGLTYLIKTEIDSTAELPQPGDILSLPVKKPFLNYDAFEFTVEGASEDKEVAKTSLNDIKVVPNPYIAGASWEPKNTFSNGRGDRAIHFIHVPKKCTIRIFSVRGELVRKIEHDSNITNGTADWDLLTHDRLDVAYGIYVYHIDAPGIGKKIGKFAIIK